MASRSPTSLSAASVLEAAKARVRRFGESKTNVTDIARSIGVSHAALYRFYPTKNAILGAIAQEAMQNEAEMAAAYVEASGSAAERLLEMLLDLHRRKRKRFLGDREIHDLYRRIVVEQPQLVAAYTERMTDLVAALIAQAVERKEWRVDDAAIAAGVVHDAVTAYIHPAFVAQLVTANAPSEDLIRATVATVARAFEAGVTYRTNKRRAKR